MKASRNFSDAQIFSRNALTEFRWADIFGKAGMSLGELFQLEEEVRRRAPGQLCSTTGQWDLPDTGTLRLSPRSRAAAAGRLD
jgi:hypothetical protein